MVQLAKVIYAGAPALIELGAAIGPLLAAPIEAKTFTTVPTGDHDKGAH